MSQPSPQPLPDILRMNALKEAFLSQLYGCTQALLPALREQLDSMAGRLLDTDRLIADQVLSALVLLGNHKWDNVGTAREDTLQVLEQDAQRDAQRLEGKGREIADALAALAKLRMPAVDERSDALTGQQNALDEAIAGQQARIAALDEQITAMAEVINAFDVPDLMKIFNRMIPTEAELAMIQQTLLKGVSPDLLVGAARTFLDKLSGVVEGRKLADLISARNRKVIEHGALIDELAGWKDKRKTIERELGQLPQIAALEGARDEWLEEARNLSRSWAAQVEAISTQTTLQGMAAALCAMEEFLLTVRRRYEDI